MSDKPESISANPGYALGQLARSLLVGTKKATERAGLWKQALQGMLDGTIRVGARAPLKNAPAWVTPQVLHGGFASGNMAASGPLQAHEKERLGSLGLAERLDLNLYYSSEEGRAELASLLGNGCYRVSLPEEGALLLGTWLLKRGESARAEALLAEIAPFYDRLRFYPVPHPRPLTVRSGVYRWTVGKSVKALREQRPQVELDKMTEAIRVWAPLYDRSVELFLETVEGPLPTLRKEGDRCELLGGVPCRHFPPGWKERALALLEDYNTARLRHKLCGKPVKKKENFYRLRVFLDRCLESAAQLDERDIGQIRRILAGYLTRRGAPSSEEVQELRSRQERDLAGPTHRELAGVLADRLAELPADEGSTEVTSKLGPLDEEEARRLGASRGRALPPGLLRKAELSWEAPVEVLIERGLLTSAESLAEVVPLLTAQVKAEAISDPELSRAYESVYRAFRNRRSLLLLNYQSQVRLEELPWVAAVAPWLGGGEQVERDALEVLRRVAGLALSCYPYTLIPNKLIKELRTLGKDAGQPQPFVDELAADIFMGGFSANYLRAALVAADLLRGSLYERYYGSSYEQVNRLRPEVGKDLERFAKLCRSLAGNPGGSWVAQNGAVIEQAQILTTHNLAVLFGPLGMRERLGGRLGDMSRRCFEQICHRQTLPIRDWRAQMQTVKDSAYAWRQMLFYLSISGRGEEFVPWARRHLANQDEDFQRRFEPVMAGLEAVLKGEAFDPEGHHSASGGRRLLGWTMERHWLLPPGDADS